MTEMTWSLITDEAQRLAAEQDLSGILRVTRAGEPVWEVRVGYADRAHRIPVESTTRFATASLSKMFTAVGILDAAGRGELGLDDPIVSLLAPEDRPTTLRDDVTVHHLLSHTSGIADYFEEDEELPGYREDYGALWEALPTYRVRDYRTLLPLFADLPPVCPPGTAHHYSNAGYVLLGIILSEVSGLPFADAVVRRVFEPAGMAASGYPALDEVHADIAQGYLRPLTPDGPWRTNVFSVPAVGGGDGGAVVSAPDVERFLRCVREGGVWQGVTPELVLTPRVTAQDRWAPGYGVDVRDDGVFCKDGGDPGVAAFARSNPTTDTTVVLLANIGWEHVEGLSGLLRLVIDAADQG
jgi:CubicO group peptidase (beta-lactamase class C family)